MMLPLCHLLLNQKVASSSASFVSKKSGTGNTYTSVLFPSGLCRVHYKKKREEGAVFDETKDGTFFRLFFV
jgi:hypothetical protein